MKKRMQWNEIVNRYPDNWVILLKLNGNRIMLRQSGKGLLKRWVLLRRMTGWMWVSDDVLWNTLLQIM